MEPPRPCVHRRSQSCQPDAFPTCNTDTDSAGFLSEHLMLAPRFRVRDRHRLPHLLVTLSTADRSSTADATAAAQQLSTLLADTDNALEAGFRGGHRLLLSVLERALRWSAEAGAAEDAEALCDAVAGAIAASTAALPSYLSFPLLPAPETSYPPPPHRLCFGAFRGAPTPDEARLARWWPPLGTASLTAALCAAATPDSPLAQELEVLVRPVPRAIFKQVRPWVCGALSGARPCVRGAPGSVRPWVRGAPGGVRPCGTVLTPALSSHACTPPRPTPLPHSSAGRWTWASPCGPLRLCSLAGASRTWTSSAAGLRCWRSAAGLG